MGWPIEHSRSPRLHGHWLRRYGVEGHYVPLGVRPEGTHRQWRASALHEARVPRRQRHHSVQGGRRWRLADAAKANGAALFGSGVADTITLRPAERRDPCTTNTDGYGFLDQP